MKRCPIVRRFHRKAKPADPRAPNLAMIIDCFSRTQKNFMTTRIITTLLCLVISPWAFSQETPKLTWEIQKSDSNASLRGLCVVDENVVWASGSGGTVLRTTNGGQTWDNVSLTDADEMDFRDVHAFDENVAVITNAGQPAVFYRTVDGGITWKEVFRHDNENSFFDAVAAINSDHLIAMSDPVDDRILLVESLDRGETWTELPAARRPEKLEGEAGFAASGSNMIVEKDTGSIYLALGSHMEGKESDTSRVMVSKDAAKTWTAFRVPMKRTPSSGIFSLTCLPEVPRAELTKIENSEILNGVCVMVGGNYLDPEDHSNNIAVGPIGKENNFMVPTQKTRGYRSGVTHTLIDEHLVVIAVGPDGSDVSFKYGTQWQALNDEGFHAVKSTQNGAVWASGADGRIAKLVVSED